MLKFIIFAVLISEGLSNAIAPEPDLSNLVLEYQTGLKSGDRSESYYKTLATLGILQGTVNVDKRMQQNTLRKLDGIKDQYQKKNFKGVEKRLKKLTDSMQRDKKAIEILQNTLKVSMSLEKLQHVRKTSKEKETKMNQTEIIKIANSEDFKKVEENILGQLKATHGKVNETVYEIVNKMKSGKKRKLRIKSSTPATITSSVATTHGTAITDHDRIHFPPVYVHMAAPAWSSLYQVDDDGFIRFRRQNEEKSDGDVDEKTENQVDTKESSEFDDDFPAPSMGDVGGGGGITGLIASLR